MGKKRISTKKAMAIFLPVIAVLLALMVVVTSLMNTYAATMDMFFGYGDIIVGTAERDENAVADYYSGILDPEKYASKEAAKANASTVSKSIVAEGMVLLKNENSLPLSKSAKITLLGADTGYADAFGGVFSSVLNKTVTKMSEGLLEDAWDETADYSANNDAAVVIIYRQFGESNDADLLAADGIRTELSLTTTELDLLDNACKNFDNVIVLIAAANAIEASFLTEGANYVDPHYNTAYDFSNIRGAMWVSTGNGDDGAGVIAQLLCGDINPSGRLVDTYIANHKNDPTYVNSGNFMYTNGDLGENGYKSNGLTAGQATKTTFLELEEGIYFGYRYYETAAYEASQGNYEGFDYDAAVVYPFGYGLSYTTFESAYEGTPSYDEQTNQFTFKVKVTNTGSVAGKYVAEIFCNQPYIPGGVEKAHVVLAGFAKTDLLEPGASQVLEITVDRDYICSYDYETEKCYILDAGDYCFYLSEDAHSWASIEKTDSKKCWVYTLDSKIVFNEDNKRPGDNTAAVNVMDDETNWKFADTAQNGTGYATNFSRSDFKGTYPTAPTGDDFVAQQQILDARTVFDTAEKADEPVDDLVITGSMATSYVLADLRGVDIDDEMWNEYVQQLSADKLVEMYSNGNWQTVADSDNGVPRGIDLDGPEGLSAQAIDTSDAYNYQDDTVLAATWNVECASDMGTAVAYEFMAYGFTGWYGPGMNIHRSAFCGRNAQYYSEDPALAGAMAVAECSACSEGGMITYLKHFAVNIQETNRDGNLCTWVNEQALRECYLAGWERYMKDATMTVKYYGTNENGEEVLMEKEMSAATAIMTAYNLVGATWIGANEAIMQDIVREEFGFTGISLTDAINNNTVYMDTTHGLYSGATNLCLSQTVIRDSDNDYALSKLQQSAKYVLYNKANSNLLQLYNLFPGVEITYGESPWRMGLNIAWGVVGVVCAGLAAGLVVIVIQNNKSKKYKGEVNK